MKPKYKAVYVVDLPSMTCTRHATAETPEAETPLVEGTDGFLKAEFDDGDEYKTELSNLMLHAALPPKKRPAAADAPAADEPPPVAQPAADAPAADAPVAAAPVAGPAMICQMQQLMQALEEPEDAARGQLQQPDAAAAAKDYRIEYYGKGGKNSIGIKRRFGAKNQILSVGVTTCTKSRDEMMSIGNELVKDLQGGMSIQAAKDKGKRLAYN